MTSEPALGPQIGGGHQSDVFEYGKDVCKLYGSHISEPQSKRMADREAAALRIVEAFEDVSAPRLLGVRQIGKRWGMIMSRIEGRTFAGTLHDPEYMREMARLHVAIHRHQALALPTLKVWLSEEIQKARTKLGAALPLQRLLDRLNEMPDSDRLCHGDFQPSNVMGTPGAASVIDWTHASLGDPALDVCQSWLLMGRSDEAVASAYVDTYAKESGRDSGDILRWRSIVAAARLADNVPGEVNRLIAIVVDGLRDPDSWS